MPSHTRPLGALMVLATAALGIGSASNADTDTRTLVTRHAGDPKRAFENAIARQRTRHGWPSRRRGTPSRRSIRLRGLSRGARRARKAANRG